MERPSVLVVDDREIDRKLLDRTLTLDGYQVATASGGAEALELIGSRLFDVAIVDLRMPGMDGLELLRAIKRHDAAIEVVLMTAEPTVPTAVEALREGAYDYVAKPLNLQELRHTMSRLMERSALRREVKTLRTKLGESLAARELIGGSTPMARVKEMVRAAAPTDSPVLIEGESGTGKELVAAAIHRLSARSAGPFIPVNCSAVPSELLESEFFGHVRGAFSGAVADAQGLFRSAHGGTLFLDEVVELPPALQAKLLRVLQESEVRPVGATKSCTVDVRIVAATNRPLDAAIRDGSLRQDFFYRLNVVHIMVPPLRERRADIPALAHHFLRRFNERFTRQVREVDREAMAALMAYDFPGNVRQLENLLERAYALGTGEAIGLGDLPALASRAPETLPPDAIPPLAETLRRVERELIVRALQVHGDKEKAAHALGVSPRTLYRRLSDHGLL